MSSRACRQFKALVELHGNIGAEQCLNFDRALGRQCDHRAIEMRTKRHALLVQFAQFGERHHLEAAGIRQDRQRPVHEFVQAAKRRDPLGAGPQHQMIGIAEHDLGAGRTHVIRHQALHRALRADRHEGGRLHAPMRGDEFAAARGAVGLDQAEGKRLGHWLFRHGRACPGHPRLEWMQGFKDVDARHKAGHDDIVNRRVQQTRIAIRIETIAAGNRMRIGALHGVEAAERRDQHEQRRARQMKIGEHQIHRREICSRG